MPGLSVRLSISQEAFAPPLIFLFFLAAIFVSCGPVHHAIQPTAEDIRGLKRIAVVIPNDGEFVVLFDRATATTAPAVLFGLVGAAIASAHNQSRDMEKVTALNPHLANLSGRTTFTDAFSQTLKNSARQTDIQLFEKVPDESQTKNFDAVLTFDIRTWGLRLANRDDERLAPFIELETTLIRARDNQTLWNMHDTFLGQKRSYFAEYKEDGPMLRNEMKEAIGNAGARMANKIIYPRGATN
jgi:hypothetical protein